MAATGRFYLSDSDLSFIVYMGEWAAKRLNPFEAQVVRIVTMELIDKAFSSIPTLTPE